MSTPQSTPLLWAHQSSSDIQLQCDAVVRGRMLLGRTGGGGTIPPTVEQRVAVPRTQPVPLLRHLQMCELRHSATQRVGGGVVRAREVVMESPKCGRPRRCRTRPHNTHNGQVWNGKKEALTHAFDKSAIGCEGKLTLSVLRLM